MNTTCQNKVATYYNITVKVQQPDLHRNLNVSLDVNPIYISIQYTL